MTGWLIVARKELRDHLRDTRSLASALLYALMGPGVVLLVSFSSLAPNEGGAGFLSLMASVFALVTAFAGGMNVAMDALAGERERRSLVPLLLTPVPRLDLLIGKWLAASIFALAAVAVSIAGLLGVLVVAAGEPAVTLVVRLSPWVWCGLVPLALLGSAVHLLVAVGSRSVKEAQGWQSMAVFVPMLAGLSLVFFPGWIGEWWFVVPIVGPQALLARTIGGGPSQLGGGLVLAGITLTAAFALLGAAGAALNREGVLAD